MLTLLQKLKPGRASWPTSLVSRPLLGLGVIAVLAALLGGGIWIVYLHTHVTVITNGADRWASDQRATAAAIPFASPETAQIAVDPAFTAYYQAHDGAALLGAPVTPGFPIAQGWIQFFTANALLLPGAHQAATPKNQEDQQISDLMQDGLQDQHTGIIQLPLLHTLLTVGSEALVGGGLTYVDLRNATNPSQMRPVPATENAAPGTFIQAGTRDGEAVGHLIPAALWAYITKPAVSPDGWQTDFGLPLTEAIPFVTVQYGVSHRMLIQAFWRGALIMDRDTSAAGQPIIQPLATGVAYLQTLVPPAPAPGAHTSIWSSSNLLILDAPLTGKATLQIGQSFPLTLTGATRWDAGTLWYQVKWKAAKTFGVGWVPASGITFTAPKHPASSAAWAPASGAAASVPTEHSAWAAFDQLSPALAQYLASLGDHTGAVVYDLTRQHAYAYHLDNQYIMGNSIKLPILLAFLAMIEQQGRRLSGDEMQQITRMMTSPDDDAGAELYNEIGRATGLTEYLNQPGISGLEADYDNLGYSMVKPLAMAQLLTLLDEGKLLTPPDRTLVFSLLENNPPDQQVGVGDTRPQGAIVAMRDGWLVGTDALWAMNSSGIVTLGNETYVISVYSAHLNSLAEGQAIARQVCKSVAAILQEKT